MSTTDIILTAALTIVPIVSLIIAIVVARRNKDKDIKSDAITFGKMQADLEYIKTGVDDLKKSEKDHDDKLDKISDRLSVVETSLSDHVNNRQLHHISVRRTPALAAASKGAKKK